MMAPWNLGDEPIGNRVNLLLVSGRVHPRKLTCPLERDYFIRKYISSNFQSSFFREYVLIFWSIVVLGLIPTNRFEGHRPPPHHAWGHGVVIAAWPMAEPQRCRQKRSGFCSLQKGTGRNWKQKQGLNKINIKVASSLWFWRFWGSESIPHHLVGKYKKSLATRSSLPQYHMVFAPWSHPW